jgi:hypothetical protein
MDCWDPASRVSDKENDDLDITFSSEELEEVVKNTKTATAPGANGFPVALFMKC